MHISGVKEAYPMAVDYLYFGRIEAHKTAVQKPSSNIHNGIAETELGITEAIHLRIYIFSSCVDT